MISLNSVPNHFFFDQTLTAWKVYNWTYYILTFILVCLFGYSLLSILRGSNHKFSKRLVLGLFLANVTDIIARLLSHSINPVISYNEPLTTWVWLKIYLTLAFLVLTYSLFNASICYFGFHYYKCQAKLKFV